MKTNEELRELSVDELNKELLTIRKQQFLLRIKKASDSLDKTHLIAIARKSVARLKTILTEKVGKIHEQC